MNLEKDPKEIAREKKRKTISPFLNLYIIWKSKGNCKDFRGKLRGIRKGYLKASMG